MAIIIWYAFPYRFRTLPHERERVYHGAPRRPSNIRCITQAPGQSSDVSAQALARQVLCILAWLKEWNMEKMDTCLLPAWSHWVLCLRGQESPACQVLDKDAVRGKILW